MHDDKNLEMKLAEQCPAVLINRCVAQANKQVVRLTFFEVFGPTIEPRTAICMSLDDATAIYRLIGELLTKAASVQGLH